MTQDYIHPLQSLRAVMVQKRRTLAESLLSSRPGQRAKRRKKLIKLQKEIDVIDDAIADEQMLSPSLREQVAKERTGDADRQGQVSECVATTAESMERTNARLAELSEHLNEAALAAVSNTEAG